jgi:hypothetical protein
MTKGDIIKAMADFPDDMPVKIGEDIDVTEVVEICPTGTGTSENYLLLKTSYNS